MHFPISIFRKEFSIAPVATTIDEFHNKKSKSPHAKYFDSMWGPGWALEISFFGFVLWLW